MQKNKNILNCRLCNSSKFQNLYTFGKLPLGNNLQSTYLKAIKSKVYPLNVIRCKNCHHFQLDYSVSPKLLYATNYTYLSGVGKSFVEHIKKFVKFVVKNCQLKNGQFVLEIGSNDGTCLLEFKKYNLKVAGIDPAKIPVDIANKKGVPTLNNFFDKESANLILKKFGNPDVITSQNALAHIDDLQGTFQKIFDILKLDGFFIFEVGYFGRVLKKALFDTIYHEHLDYHHAIPLIKLLFKIGFSIKNISLNETQGGTIRFVLKKEEIKKIDKHVKSFLIMEQNSELYDNTFLNRWIISIQKNLKKLHDYLSSENKTKIPVVGYGAPTKATLLLELANLKKNSIDFIVEDNPLKIDKYLPKHGVQIKSTNELKKLNKFFIVILAWNFSKDIINKLKKYDKEIIVLIPLPKFKVIKI